MHARGPTAVLLLHVTPASMQLATHAQSNAGIPVRLLCRQCSVAGCWADELSRHREDALALPHEVDVCVRSSGRRALQGRTSKREATNEGGAMRQQ